jgi:hypothetical protein
MPSHGQSGPSSVDGGPSSVHNSTTQPYSVARSRSSGCADLCERVGLSSQASPNGSETTTQEGVRCHRRPDYLTPELCISLRCTDAAIDRPGDDPFGLLNARCFPLGEISEREARARFAFIALKCSDCRPVTRPRNYQSAKSHAILARLIGQGEVFRPARQLQVGHCLPLR